MNAPLVDPIMGLDEDWSKVDPATAKAQGYHFAVAYVSQDTTGKNITRPQIDALHAAGLDVALVFEYNPTSAMGGAYAGTQDATIAVQRTQALGAPRGIAIYFAIDFPVGSDRALQLCDEYIQAAYTVCRGVGYRADAYGGKEVISYLLDRASILYGWQTYAWSGGLWDDRAALRQVQNGVHVGSATVDRDEQMRPNFGQWRPDGSVGGVEQLTQTGDPEMFLAIAGSQYMVCDGMSSRPISPEDAATLAYLATSARGGALQLARSIDGKNNDEWTSSPGGGIPGIVRLGWTPAFGALPAQVAPAPAPAPSPAPAPTGPEQQLLDLWARVAGALEGIEAAMGASTIVHQAAQLAAPTPATFIGPGDAGAQADAQPGQLAATAAGTAPVDTQP